MRNRGSVTTVRMLAVSLFTELLAWLLFIKCFFQRLREGVVRDLERLERKKENLKLLEEQRILTRHLEEERRQRETEVHPQGHH